MMPRNSVKHIGRRLCWLLLDAILLNLSLFLSQAVRYSALEENNYLQSLRLCPFMTVIMLGTLAFFGHYSVLWEYFTAEDLLRVIGACFIGTGLTYGFSLLGNVLLGNGGNLFLLHRIVYLLHWLFSSLLISFSRYLYRTVVIKKRQRILQQKSRPIRVMIVGAGHMAASLIQEIQSGMWGNRLPVVAVDDEPVRIGRRIRGIPIERGTHNIFRLVSDYEVQEIILAIHTPASNLKPLLEKCLTAGCPVQFCHPLLERVSKNNLA